MVKADGEPCVPTPQGRCDSKAPQYQVGTQDGPSDYFYGSSEYSPIKILPIYTHPGLQQGFPLQKKKKNKQNPALALCSCCCSRLSFPQFRSLEVRTAP